MSTPSDQIFSNYLEETLFAVWKITQFFLQSEHRDRLEPSPPPVVFHSLFKDPPGSFTTNPLLQRVRWKS